MKWFIYNFLFSILNFLMMPKFIFRMCRRGGYANRMCDRFGFYPKSIREKLADGSPRIWIHAVSVGEVSVARQMMQKLRDENPETKFVLSTTSSTGWAQAEKGLDENDILIYGPLDYSGNVKRAFNAIRPVAYIVTETEIWPNILRECHANKIPQFLINARISDRSAPGYRRLRFWFGPVLNLFTHIFAQSQQDANRLIDAGCDAKRITVSGSMKFDVATRSPELEAKLSKYLEKFGITRETPILLGGSTWPGEDAVMLRLYETAKKVEPKLRLIIVPRHFEKADSVAMTIEKAGFQCIRKSKNETPENLTDTAVILADTTGELIGFYGLSTYTFVGKSLCEHGAQNMIEPCVCGNATLVGPFTENFRPVMADLLAADALRQRETEEELTKELISLLKDKKECESLRSRAKECSNSRIGVTGRIAKIIAEKTGEKKVSENKEEKAKSPRLLSLDVLRGWDMIFLIGIGPLVLAYDKAFGVPEWLRFQMRHVDWVGITAWDMIMPLFMFMAGIAIPFASSRYFYDGRPTLIFWLRLFRRGLILWFLGMVIQGNVLSFDLPRIYFFTNTLQAIAVGYIVATIISLIPIKCIQAVITVSLILVYAYFLDFGSLTIGKVVYGLGDYTPQLNYAIGVDKLVFGSHGNGDPKYAWCLTSLAFSFFVLAGMHAGQLLRWATSPERKLLSLSIIGVASLIFGLILCSFIPPIKAIYTPSFTFVATGICFLLMAFTYLCVDYLNITLGSSLISIFGKNALLAYVLSEYCHPAIFRFVKLFTYGLPHFYRPELCHVINESLVFCTILLILYLCNRANCYLRA